MFERVLNTFSIPASTKEMLNINNQKIKQHVQNVFLVEPYFWLHQSDDDSSYFMTEVVVRRCSVKKVLLEISENSQGNTCVRVSLLIKLQAEACNFIKKATMAQITEHVRWLLLPWVD